MSESPHFRISNSLFLWFVCLTAIGCAPNPRIAELTRENQSLREQRQKIEHEWRQCEAELVGARSQLEQAVELGPDRPVDLFAPVSIEIASLSGGANYDNRPGDDGITVHLRPKDADGQVVKAPGRITIQLLDNTDMAAPKVITVCTVEKAEELRQSWMGILGTNHYSIRCRFPEGVSLPASQKLLVGASFVDFLTGKTLSTAKEVSFFSGNGSQ